MLAGPAAAISMKSRRGLDRFRTSTGTGFAHPITGHCVNERNQWKEDRANGIDMHRRVERHAAQLSRGGIAEPIGRPRMGGLVHRQRHEQHAERNEYLGEINRRQDSPA